MPPDSALEQATPTALRIAEAGAEVLREQGPGGLTYRSVAAQIGTQPSLLNYHFPEKPLLLRAAFDVLVDDACAAVKACSEGLQQRIKSGSENLQADAIAFLLEEVSFHQGWISVGFFELCSQALREAEYKPLVAHYVEAFSEAVTTIGAGWLVDRDADRQRVVVNYLIGECLRVLPPLTSRLDMLVFRNRIRAFITDIAAGRETLLALFTRLAATPVSELAHAEPAPLAPATADDDQSESRRERIINAAIELIAEDGVENLSHRAIAARADSSLSATTYYFDSKREIIAAAYDRIKEGIMHAAISVDTKALRRQGFDANLAAMRAYFPGPGRRNTVANFRLAIDACRAKQLKTFTRDAAQIEFNNMRQIVEACDADLTHTDIQLLLGFLTGQTLADLLEL